MEGEEALAQEDLSAATGLLEARDGNAGFSSYGMGSPNSGRVELSMKVGGEQVGNPPLALRGGEKEQIEKFAAAWGKLPARERDATIHKLTKDLRPRDREAIR